LIGKLTNAGTFFDCEPKTMNSTCSTVSATVSVIISTARLDRRSGRTRIRSIAMPNTATTATDSAADRISGSLSRAVKL
jgi:hypothetical protein